MFSRIGDQESAISDPAGIQYIEQVNVIICLVTQHLERDVLRDDQNN